MVGTWFLPALPWERITSFVFFFFSFARRLAMFHPSVGIAPVDYIIDRIGWKNRRKVAQVDFHLDEVWDAAAF